MNGFNPQPAVAFPTGSSERKRGGFLSPQAPDPLESVEYTGDIAVDSQSELDALSTAFRDRRKAEDRRFTLATDSEFWVALCFRTRADKDRFIRRANLMSLGDKYLDGHRVASALGIDLSD